MKEAIENWLSGKGYGFNGEAFLSLEKTARPTISELVEECMTDIGPKWVSVADALPDEKRPIIMVAVNTGSNDYITDQYSGWYSCDEWARWPHKFSPTNWMYAPESPQ